MGGARAYGDTWIRGHRLCFGVALGFARAAIAGHLLDVGRHRGLVRRWGPCWLALALLWSGYEWSVGQGCGFWLLVG